MNEEFTDWDYGVKFWYYECDSWVTAERLYQAFAKRFREELAEQKEILDGNA